MDKGEYEERRGRGRGRGRGRPRGRPRGSHRGGRGSKRNNSNKIEIEENEVTGQKVADENVPPIPNKYDADCDISSLVAPTFTTLDQGPPAPMLRLSWDNPVNLIGEKVLSPRIHICDTCNKPVLIYGRMIPCKHVFCLWCAKGEDRVCARCGERVSRVEQTGLGSVYMCPFTINKAICKRTYLSQRDLQAHIDHRHMKAASSGKQKEDVKEDRLNHRDPRAGGGAGGADARNHEAAVRGPDPRQELNRNDPRANKDNYDHGTYTGQQQFQGQDTGQFGVHPEGTGHGGNRGPPGPRSHGGAPHHAGGHPSAPGGHHGPAGHHSGPGPRDHRDSGHHGGGGHHARPGGHSAGGGPPRGGPGTQASHHIPVMTSSRTNLITVPLQQDPTDHNSGAAPFNSHPPAPQHPPPHMPPSHPPPSHSFNTPPPNQPPPHGPPPHSQPPPFSTSFNSNYNNQNPQYTFAHNPSGPPPQNPSNIPQNPFSGGPPHAGRPPPSGPPPTTFSGRPPFEQQYSGNQWSTPPPQAGPPSHPPPSHPPPRPPHPHHQPPPNAQSGPYYGRKSF